MKKILLKELNLHGTLLFSFKRYFANHNSNCRPVRYFVGGPTTCYLHYYKGDYVFTSHVLSDCQILYDDYNRACSFYSNFVENLCL